MPRLPLVLLFVMLAACPALGQEEAPPPQQANAEKPLEIKDRAQAVDGLNHEDYEIREQAQGYLLRDNTLDQAQLRELLLKAKTEEQRHRLIRVAEHHVLRIARERAFGPKPEGRNFIRPASVGFSYNSLLADENPVAHRIGLIIKATMPGFPAFAHLKPGDIIVKVDDSEVPSYNGVTNWLSDRISRRQAGDKMSFRVVRNGKAIDITLVCAERVALSQMYDTDAVNAASRTEPFNRIWVQARQELVQGLPQPKPLTPAE